VTYGDIHNHMSDRFYLDQHLVEPATNTILVDQKRHKIEPKIMQVLLCLVESNGEVVSKQTLFLKVWPDTVVVEMVLTRAISHLRSVLKDDATKPTFIETISKKGYRLMVTASKKPRKQSPLAHKPIFIGALLVLVLLVLGYLAAPPDPPVGIKPFTTEKGWEYHPDISPNGEWVAYVSRQGQEISLKVSSTQQDSTLSLEGKPNYYRPRWSKTMKALSYFSADTSGVKLHLHPFDPAVQSAAFAVQTNIMSMDWHPARNALVYIGIDSTSGRNDLFEYSIDDRSTRQLAITPEGVWGDLEPSYSPDGNELAFVRTVSEGNQDVYLKDLESGETRRLTQWNTVVNGIDWLDDTYLVASTEYTGGAGLWKIHARKETSEKMLALPYGQNIANPTVHSGQFIGELWQQDVDIKFFDGNPAKGLNSSMWDLHPAFSHQGDMLALSSNRSGNYEIWLYDSLKESSRQLTDDQGPFNGKPKWSLNDKYLVYETVTKGSSAIKVVEVATGQLFKTIGGASDQINPSWSADGNCLYFASNRGGQWNIFKQELQSEEAVRITKDGALFLQEAPWPNSRKFYVSLEKPGIFELLSDGQSVLVIPELQKSDWGNWQVTKDALYYYDRADKALVRYDLQTGEKRSIQENVDKVPLLDASFHFSETTGAFVIGEVNTYRGDLVNVSNLF